MRHSNHGRLRQQVQFLRRQFLQNGDLPFTDILTEKVVAQALTALSKDWLDRFAAGYAVGLPGTGPEC